MSGTAQVIVDADAAFSRDPQERTQGLNKFAILGVEMNGRESGQVLVQVVPVDQGQEIGWGDNVAEQLENRIEDIRDAIASGSSAVADSLPGLPAAQGWRLGQVSASFGVTLKAEAGAILSKASGEATFEVTITYQHNH